MDKKRVFISHSHKDKLIATSLADLLEKIGIDRKNILNTSDPKARIPAGRPLYTELRKTLADDNVFVLFLLSDNFYSSTICMNEMGAAWVKDAKYHYFVLPGFSIDKVEGVILERNQIGISLSEFSDMTKSQLMDICSDLADHFNLSVNNDTVELGLIRFASALEAYNEQSAGNLAFRMTNVKSFCIGDADNDGCRISRKESSDSKTTVNIDFELTASKLCSISYCVEQPNWSFFEKHGKHLCFEVHSNAKLFEAEIELHFSDHNEIVPILIDDDRRGHRISLAQFSASEADWECVKEVCVLFRKKYIDHSVTVVVENLRLE